MTKKQKSGKLKHPAALWQRITNKVKGWIHFVEKDIWRISAKDLSPGKSFLIQQLRIIMLAFRGFNEDKVAIRASALTYYTLFALVPVVALAFGIATGVGI